MTDRVQKKKLREEAKVEYKQRTEQIRSLDRNNDPFETQELIAENFNRGDELYSRVKRKLDGTAADARHMKELVNLCQESSKRINASSSQFDLKKTLVRLLNEHGKQELVHVINDRLKTCLLIPPTFEFFYGTFKDLEVKARKKKAPREKEVATQATTAQERNLDSAELEQDCTPKEVERINEHINRLARDKDEGIPFFPNLIDKESFTLTVENIFHASFLVKEGRVRVKRNRAKRPVLVVDQEVTQPAASAGNQSILSFSMGDYKKWLQAPQQ